MHATTPLSIEELVRVQNFSSPQQCIAWLTQALDRATMQLHAKERTEEACEANVRAIYDVAFKRLADRVRELEPLAQRYRLLRRYRVRVRPLGVSATGAALDTALDEKLRTPLRAITESAVTASQ